MEEQDEKMNRIRRRRKKTRCRRRRMRKRKKRRIRMRWRRRRKLGEVKQQPKMLIAHVLPLRKKKNSEIMLT